MYKIIEKLEKKLKDKAISIIDKRDDGFAYFIAVQHNEKTFVVFTTKGIHHIRNDGDCLIALDVKNFIPFASVSDNNGNFTEPYLSAIRAADKIYTTLITEKNYGLRVEQLPFFQ